MVAKVLSPLIAVEEWTLEELHSLGLGWGLAVIVLTLLTRLVLLPATIRQLRAQRRLRDHAPNFAALRDRHREDPARLKEEMAAYYREHGVSPFSALGPVVLQIPIFISLYYVLRTDVATGLFGHAGFLFIPDLTARAHGAVLLTLILGYMSLQLAGSALATRTLEGGHRRLAMLLPVVFVGVASRFPAGLLVYWVTSSFWTLGQHLASWRLAAAVPGAAVPLATPPAAPNPRPHSRSKKKKGSRRRR